MTNAVMSLTSLALSNGYMSLYAKVRQASPASIAVLKRAGFKRDMNWYEDPMRSRYVLKLTR
jgi:RimJ/RimL family protein N-acetyltransferase